MGVNEILEKKVSKKHFLMLIGAFIIGIFAMTKGVFAKVFFRDESGNMYSLSQETPKNLYIKATGQSEGDLHLSDSTNWNVSKSLINKIVSKSDSTDYTIYLLGNDSGLSSYNGVAPLWLLNPNLNAGTSTIKVDNVYTDEDNSKEVHLTIVDNAGDGTYWDIYIDGERSS